MITIRNARTGRSTPKNIFNGLNNILLSQQLVEKTHLLLEEINIYFKY